MWYSKRLKNYHVSHTLKQGGSYTQVSLKLTGICADLQAWTSGCKSIIGVKVRLQKVKLNKRNKLVWTSWEGMIWRRLLGEGKKRKVMSIKKKTQQNRRAYAGKDKKRQKLVLSLNRDKNPDVRN